MFELMFGVYHRGRTVVNVKTDKIQKVLQALFSYAQDIFYKKGRTTCFRRKNRWPWARESAQVPVDYTFAKHLKKPVGAKPGKVIYHVYNTLTVNPDREQSEKLRVQ